MTRDELLELAAAAVRAHTRAMHALEGKCDYTTAELRATGRWLAEELQRARRDEGKR